MWLFQGLAKGYSSILLFLALSVHESLAMRPSTRRSTVTMTKVDTAQKVVILGAGIHGASVAHYLSSRFGIFPTIVERVSVAAAASGKAGGFLAREWGSGTTQQLHQVSFDMHEKLGKLENSLQNSLEIPSTENHSQMLIPTCSRNLILNSRGAESRILPSCEDTVSRWKFKRKSRCNMAR